MYSTLLNLSMLSLSLLPTASESLVRIIDVSLTSASLRRANEPLTVSANGGMKEIRGERRKEEGEIKHDNVNIGE